MSLARSTVVVFALLLATLTTAPAGRAQSLGGSDAAYQTQLGREVWEVSTLDVTGYGSGFVDITGAGLRPGTVLTYTAQGGGVMESGTVPFSRVLLDGSVSVRLFEVDCVSDLTVFVATATTVWRTSISSDPITLTDC